MSESSFPSLSALALKLINVPGSSAEIERLFGGWGRLHTAIRNRLKPEVSRKLVHINYSLRNSVIIEEERKKRIHDDIEETEACVPVDTEIEIEELTESSLEDHYSDSETEMEGNGVDSDQSEEENNCESDSDEDVVVDSLHYEASETDLIIDGIYEYEYDYE